MAKNTIFIHNPLAPARGISANGSVGAAGNILASNGSGVYWSASAGAGFTGSQGVQGPTGYTGSQGIIGYTGSLGGIGFTGSAGFSGSVGFIGSRGFTGSVGFTGSQGIQGVTGFTGSQGIQGVTGFTGSQGIQGTVGFTGSVGFVGSRGFTGSAGFTGSQGIQGVTGFTGSVGFTGSAGFTGSQGAIGYTGSFGPVAGSDGQLIYNNSGVAAGTANASYDDVTNTLIARYMFAGGGGGGNLLTFNDGSTQNIYATITTGSGAAGSFNWDTNNGAAHTWKIAGAEAMRLAGNGNVGIGTASPTAKLHITGGGLNVTGPNSLGVTFAKLSATFETSIAFNDDIGTQSTISLNTNNDFIVNGPNSKITRITAGNSGTLDLAAGSSGIATFSVNGSERMRIASNGHVGIGNSTPATPLDVRGSGRFGDAAGGNQTVEAYSTSTRIQLFAGGTTAVLSNTDIRFGDLVGTYYGTFAANGNFGAGTTSPTSRLHVVGSGVNDDTATIEYTAGSAAIRLKGNPASQQNFYFGDTVTYRGSISYDNATDRMVIGTNSAERMRIDSAGNVAIGTTVTSSKLIVNGNINAGNSTTGWLIDNVSGLGRLGYSYTGTERIAIGGPGFGIVQAGMYVYGNEVMVGTPQNGSNILNFATANTERMRIDAGGNVAIGSTTASSKVTSNGTVESTSGGFKFPDGTTQITATQPLGLWDYWVECMGSSSNMFPWAVGLIGSGTASGTPSTAITRGYNPWGTLFRSSTTVDSGGNLRQVVNQQYFGVLSQKFRCGLTGATAFTNSTIRVGFLDTLTVADATDGAYFEINGSGVSSAKTAAAATRTTHGTTYTLTIDKPYVFDIEVNAAGTSVRFRIYEEQNTTAVYDQTITTNIPTTTGNITGSGVTATNSGGAAVDICVVHYLMQGTIAGFNRARGQ